MFSSLAKRSNYKVIAEEEENIQGQINSSKFGQNPPSQLEETEEPEEEEEQDGTQSMFESAPPSHHGIAVSIKYGGEKDTELQRSRDDPGQWDHIKDIDQVKKY
jgi:chaperonin GroEL (HSP60 family)